MLIESSNGTRTTLDVVTEEIGTNPHTFVLRTDLMRRGGRWAQVKGLAQLMGRGRIF